MKAKGYRVHIVGSAGRQIAELLQRVAHVAVAEGKVREATGQEVFHLRAEPCIPELFASREVRDQPYYPHAKRLSRKKGRIRRW